MTMRAKIGDDVCFLGLAELGRRYGAGALSPLAAAERHLDRITLLEPHLNAFQIVDRERALAAARAAETRWRGERPLGPLDGVPVTIKDNVDVAGLPTRHGSTTTPDAPAVADSPVVARLREAGAVILGKTTLPEFGWSGLTDSRLKGVTRNPWNVARSSGGSSGGSAAAVAAGIGAIAFGNDGGGSIRVPSSFCGVFGIKPTFGRVPHVQEGLFATLVAGGPIARSVADAAATLAIMARPDDRDWHALPPPADDWLDDLEPRLAGLRLAYAPQLGHAEPDGAVRTCVDQAIDTLRRRGARIDAVGPVIAPLRPAFEAFWIAGLARRLRTIPRERWDELDPGYRRLAEQGLGVDVTAVLAAEGARAAVGRTFLELHRSYDLLLTPTMPHGAPPADTTYHLQGYDRWRDSIPFTLPFNLTGQPAASLPCGLTDAGLPVGLQVVGPKYAERKILEACLAIEAALGFAQPHPVLLQNLQGLSRPIDA
jgi:aspartyl-tRNA(Asn)/glutamyl-tRNA(Gln) amidotransferase subunit A